MSSHGSFVISGISGRYPDCRNVAELRTKLFDQIEMTNDREVRWHNRLFADLPKRKATLLDLDRFDASYFGIHSKLANGMDPQIRCLLEVAVEAILDAGVHPDTLRGTNTNVYIASGLPESFAYKSCGYHVDEKVAITGTAPSMLAGRLAYHLHLHGKAITMDTACSGSMVALNCAYEALCLGKCDAALVGASNLCLNPSSSAFYEANTLLSPDGICYALDQRGCGFARAEAVVVIFLQRDRDAKRIYAHLVHSDVSSDGFKTEGLSFPSVRMQRDLFTRFYKEIDVDPNTVAYLEGHFTATVVGDPVECASTDSVFCSNRDEPFLIGTIKSNMGHAESAAGLCGLTKLVLTLDSGFVPPNMHFKEPRRDIPSLMAGKLKVCTEVTPLAGPLCALNSFGFAGSNTHTLLRQWHKVKVNGGAPDDHLPRLVNWAGRTDDACTAIFDQLTGMPMDAEFIGLLHETQEAECTGFLCRGFGIFKHCGVTKNAVCLATEQRHFDGQQRPVVWMFSGMGSQYCTMGRTLCEIDIARDAIDQCHNILLAYDLDLWSIIIRDDHTTFDSVLHSFVGIASIQIALVNILHAVRLPMDHLIGHSVGELICSYADGNLTLEETIKCAYWRGKISIDETPIDGGMAAVGMSYANIKDQLPDGIYVACRNSSTSCTITGPRERIVDYVAELQAKQIFAKAVNTGGIAYHSKYIQNMKTSFYERLKQTIAEPKLRSNKWLTTSVPAEKAHLPWTNYSSPEYHLNNLLSPVLFEDAVRKIPSNAIVVEIAPHGLLQAIMKRELPDAIHLSMMQKGSDNNAYSILKALGRLFAHGLPLSIKRLYPPVQFPVSRGTPMIAPLLKWDHSQELFVPEEIRNEVPCERAVVVDVGESELEYMKGHVIDDRCLLPAMGYLHFVRESLVRMTPGATLNTLNVKFEDLKWPRATTLTPNTPIQLAIVINRGDGRFEVTENQTVVASGIVKGSLRSSEPLATLPSVTDDVPLLTSDDFYKELRLCGYMYDGEFRAVHSARADGRCASVKWTNDNWTTFMDGMMQSIILWHDSRTLSLPTGVRHIKINAADHLNYVQQRRRVACNSDDDNGTPVLCDVHVSRETNTIVCGGIEIAGLTTKSVPRRHQNGTKVLDRYEFVPLNDDSAVRTVDDAVRICTQLVLEVLQTKQVRVVEVHGQEQPPLIEYVQNALSKVPSVSGDLTLLTQQQQSNADLTRIAVCSDNKLSATGDSTLVIASNCMDDATELTNEIMQNLCENGFLLSIESHATRWNNLNPPTGFRLISFVRCESMALVLLQRQSTTKLPSEATTIHLDSNDLTYKWLSDLQRAIASSPSSITFVVQGNKMQSGAMGFVNCLRREQIDRHIQLIQIEDDNAPRFDLNDPLYAAQLRLGLPLNIRRNNCWGTYRHMTLGSNCTNVCLNKQSAQMNMRKIGDLSSFIWQPSAIATEHINIHYAALNFRDIMVASGRLAIDSLPQCDRRDREKVLGIEFAGVKSSGEQVMGFTSGGAIATRVNCNETILEWQVPARMSLRDAATIPVVYTTVYYAYFVGRQIAAGESILIHAGAGGVGLAAIRVALAYGLRVYTTVSSQEKRDYLRQTFPELKDNHIGNSRDCSFEQMIMHETNGEGVDYVLNSLSEDKLIASVRCVRYGGVFLEIGKYDIFNDSALGMRLFERAITFRAIFADLLQKFPNDMQHIHERVRVDLANGIIQRLRSTVFGVDDVEQAFRYVSGAKHIGKVLIEIQGVDRDAPTEIVPKVICSADAVYVLVGGLGGFGMELADWLVVRGAQHIVLNSRRGVTTAYQQHRIDVWKAMGCHVYVSRDDTTTRIGCEHLLKTAGSFGRVCGIFNLAVVLRDCAIENQTPETFDECLRPKAIATQLLDELSRQICHDLEHFVVFSSIACGLGNGGQTNYGMANAIMERIVEQRVSDGLCGKAIQWGAIGDVGVVAEKLAGKNTIEMLGTYPQRIDSCLNVIDELMCNDAAIVLSMIVANKKEQQHTHKLDLVGTVLDIIGIADIKSVSVCATLTELGVDSLMNVEIRQMLERDYDIQLSTEDIRVLTIAKLTELTNRNDASTAIELTTATDETQAVFDRSFIHQLGDESIKHLNILPANEAADVANDNAPCVLVIPGVEGLVSDSLMRFCQRLSLPAFVLQLHSTRHIKRVEDVVEHLRSEIVALNRNRQYFAIAAYSFGSIIAMEIARMLHHQQPSLACRLDHIYMIDGNTSVLYKYMESFYEYDRVKDEKFGMKIFNDFVHKNIAEQQQADAKFKLLAANSFDQRLDICVDFLRCDKHSTVYVKESLVGYFNRLAMIDDAYGKVIATKIDADITLMQATEGFGSYGDERVATETNGKVQKLTINADHLTVLDSDIVTKFIV